MTDIDLREKTYPSIDRLEEDDPIFYLNEVVLTHKIDGTNGRVIWDPDEQTLIPGSRNQILIDEENYGFSDWVNEEVDRAIFEDHFADAPVIVYGEFFKDEILGRVGYGSEPRFRVFDVFINTVFLDWADVKDVAQKLGFDVVPHERTETPSYDELQQRADDRTDPLVHPEAKGSKKQAEGFVIRPPVEMKYKSDRRMLYKVKALDFEEKQRGQTSTHDERSAQLGQEAEKLDEYITESRILSVIQGLRETNNDLTLDRSLTSEVIQATQNDIRKEADYEFSDRTMGKHGGSAIAELYHSMLDRGIIGSS